MTLLKKIKQTDYYKIVVKYFIKNFFDFTWEYLINFKGKILYFLWLSITKNKTCYELDKDKCANLIKKDFDFIDLSKNIKKDLNENVLCKIKEEIEKDNINSEYKNFTSIVTDKLSSKNLEKIFNVATADKTINTAAKYLGVFPILSIIQVYYNIPIKGVDLEGSKLWHQDGFGYRSLDFFIPLTNVDDTSGPLYIAESHEDCGIFFQFLNRIKDPIKWKNNRISIHEFKKIFKDDKIIKLQGNVGTAAICDSFQCYHRGGACEKKDRIMLRLSYQTPDAIRLKPPLKFLNDYNLKDNFFKNLLLKYMLFYRGIISDKYKKKFIHLYHLLSFRK